MRTGKRKIRAVICFVLIMSMILTACGGDATSDGEKELEKEKYGIIVLNQDGEVLSGAQVVLDGNTATTGDDGTVTFDKPQSETVSLTVTCMDYYDYSKSSFQITGNSSTVTMRARSMESHRLGEAVYKNTVVVTDVRVDLLSEYKKVSMSTPNLNFDIESAVLEDADTVSKYELHQVIDGNDKIIQTAQDGHFKNLKVSDFNVGTNIFVSVYDNKGHQTSTALNLEIGANPNVTEYSEFKFGEEYSFTVKDDVPIFGGTTVNFGFPSIPLVYEYSAEKVHIGFNVDDIFWNKEESRKEYKEMVSELIRTKNTAGNPVALIQKLRERQKRRGLMRLSGFDGGVDVAVGGYAEAGFDSSGKISTGEGSIFVTVTAEASWGWQVMVYVIPVVVDIEGSIEANLAAAVSYSFNENKFQGDVALTITPELKAKAGVGFEYLSGGVYGSAGLETKIVLASSEDEPGPQYLDLTSSIGLYAKVAFLEPKKQLKTGTFHLWTRSKNEDAEITGGEDGSEEVTTVNAYSEELYDIDNYYPITQPDQLDTEVMSVDGQDILSRNTSSGADPVTASDATTALTVFASQVQSGSAQSTYSKLYYSCYENGSWSDSIMMDEEDKNQMNPQLYCFDGDYYLLCQEADFDNTLLDDYREKTMEEQNELLRQAFLSFDLHIKKFDMETKTFTDMGCIETPGRYDYNADMTIENGVLYVYHASNDAGDFFGTDENTRNQIMRSYYQDGIWHTETVLENLNSITRLTVGVSGNIPSCVYCEDGDNNLMTTQDVSTYIYNGSVANVTGGAVTQVMYDRLPGDDTENFLIAAQRGLYRLDNDNHLVMVLENENGYTGRYAFSQNAVYDVQRVENGTEVFAFCPLEDGTFSNAVRITYEDKWQKDISAFTVDGKDKIVALSEVYDVETISSNLVSYNVDNMYDLSVDSVDVSYHDIVSMDEVPVEVLLSNCGNMPVSAESICVKDARGEELPLVDSNYSTRLVPGASHLCQLCVLTNDETAYGKWTIEAMVSGAAIDEKNTDNNTYECITGHSDFVLSSKVCNSGAYPYMLIEVENEGNVSDSANLVLLDANDISKELGSYNISSLNVGNTKIYKVRLMDEWADESGRLAVLAKVKDAENEMYTYNNYEYAYATLNYGTYNITYELDGAINSEENPSSYTTADNITFQDPTKEGYVFAGWYTSPEYDTVTKVTQLKPGSAGNITLYAKWEVVHLGDGNGDGQITLLDAQIALKVALKLMTVGTEAQHNLDIDKDETISLKDAQKVLKAALKLITL